MSGGSHSLACLGVFLQDSKIQACNLLFPIYFQINNFAADSDKVTAQRLYCVAFRLCVTHQRSSQTDIPLPVNAHQVEI